MKPPRPQTKSKSRQLLPLLLPLGLLSGCVSDGFAERLAFTDRLAADYQLDGVHRRLLQYYVSDTIRLVRSTASLETGIRDGRLVSSSDRNAEQIIIDAGTPGVVVSSGAGWMAVSFQPGSYLYFVSRAPGSVQQTDDYVDDRYYLYLPLIGNPPGSVRVGDQMYIATGESYRAYLKITREDFSSADSREQRMRGRVLR